MRLKSFGIILGFALIAAAVLTFLFDKQRGIMAFFSVTASMSVIEVLSSRRRRQVKAHLNKSENVIAEVMELTQAARAAAQITGDPQLLQSATRAQASADVLRAQIRSLKADLD